MPGPAKILGQAGTSLADLYDVEGSVAGLEQLDSENVKTVHEMGGTIASERMLGTIRREIIVDVTQTQFFEISIENLQEVPIRILGIQVFVSTTGRLNRLAVMARDPRPVQETPIWVWDEQSTVKVRMSDNDQNPINEDFLVPIPGLTYLPNLMIGSRTHPTSVKDLVLRGETTTFGAGTLDTVLLLHHVNVRSGSFSSFGLPLPGW